MSRFGIVVRLESGSWGTSSTENGELLQEIRVPGPGPTLVELELRRPKTARDAKRELLVAVGETLEVEFEVFADAVVQGRVVDGAGTGIAGASVYLGTMKDATGDEPFKPFRVQRVDAVETDPQGWFELSGVGSLVTAWHPQHASTTVPAREATRIVMRDRGRIHGWIAPDRAEAEVYEVVLDRDLHAPVSPSGEFQLEDVDPGAHGMWLPGGQILCVLVEPGATTEIRLDDILAAVEIEFLSGGHRIATPLSGALVGLGPQSSVQEIHAEVGLASLQSVLPGRYVAYFRTGTIAQLDIEASHIQVELGASRLLVRTVPARRLYLLHAGSEEDSFQRLLGARFARTVPASGELIFEPILPGTYSIVDERSGTASRVEVVGPVNEIVLP